MATDADDPDHVSVSKREVEDKEMMTSEVSSITVSEGLQGEKKKIESWLSQPPEIIEILGKPEIKQAAKDNEVADVEVINEGSVDTTEGEHFLKSPSVAGGKPQSYTEENQMNSKEELSECQEEEEKGGLTTDQNAIVEADYGQNAGVKTQTSELTEVTIMDENMDNGSSTMTTSIEQDSREISFEGEDKKSKTSSNSMGKETDPETIWPTKYIEDRKESGSSLRHAPMEEMTSGNAGPDVGRNLEEDSSMAFKEASQETVELSEKMKDVTSIDEEVQNKNLESSFVEQVEDNLGTSNKESESVMKEIVKESQIEADSQSEILENIDTADSNPTGKYDENLGSPCNVASKETERTVPDNHAETSTNIEEQRPVGSPEEILGDEIIIADDINKMEITEAKTLPAFDLDEKTPSAEFEIPKEHGNEVYANHPPVDERVHVVGEKQDKVSVSESGDLHEAIEIPNEEEKPVNETYESSISPESTISEHTATEEALNIQLTSTSEMDINIEKGCELNSEEELKEIKAEEIIEDDREQEGKASHPTFLAATKQIGEELEITSEGNGIEKQVQAEESVAKDRSTLSSGEELGMESSKVDEVHETNNGEHDTAEQIVNISVTNQLAGCFEEKTVQQSSQEDEASKGSGPSRESTTMDESAITHIPSFVEEKVEESSKEDDRDAMRSEKEDWNSNIECIERDFDATHSTEEREVRPLTDEEEPNEDLNAQSITVSSSEEATPKESNLVEVENSSSVPEICEKETKEEISDKEDSNVKGVAEETLSTEAEAGYIMQVDSSNLVLEEKGQVTTETSETGFSETSILGDNKDIEIPAARMDGANEVAEEKQPKEMNETSDELSKTKGQRELSKVETSLGDITEEHLPASSTMSFEESNLVPEVSETIREAPEKEKEDIMEKEDVKSSDVGSEKEKPEHEVSEGAEVCGGSIDTENAIPENESSAKNFEGSTKEGVEIEKAPVEFETEGHSHRIEASETKSISTHTEKQSDEEHEELTSELSKMTANDVPLEEKEKADGANEVAEKTQPEEKNETCDELSKTEDQREIATVETSLGDISEQNLPVSSTMSFEECNLVTKVSETIGEAPEKDEIISGKEETPLVAGTTEENIMEKEDGKSSHIESEKDKLDYEKAVNEVSEGAEVGGGCLDTKNAILEQEDSAKNFGSSSKESVEIEKAPVELETEGQSHGSEASETKSISSHTDKEREVEDEELTSKLSEMTVNEVSLEEKEKAEPWLSQPAETIKILETEYMQVEHSLDFANANVINKENVVTTKDDSFSKSTSEVDGKLTNNTEDSQLDTKEEMSGFQEEEKAGMITDKSITEETSYGQNAGVKIQIPDGTEGSSMDIEKLNEASNNEESKDNVLRTKTTSSEQDFRKTSFEEDKDKLGSSLVTEPTEETSSANEGPVVCKNLEGNSSMACEDESRESVKLSEEVQDVASIEDELQNKNLESSHDSKVEDICIQKVDNLETSKEESETGMKDIYTEVQKEADNQNETIENTSPADSNLSTRGNDDEESDRKADVSFTKPEESMARESEEVTPAEVLTMECRPGAMVVASEEFETSSPNEFAETITNIEEESLVGNPEEILGETRKDETVIEDDIDKKEITEAKNLSTVDLDEETRSAEVKIPKNNGNEETVLEGGEHQNEVSMLELGDQVHGVSEFPKEDEKHASEAYEASTSQESTKTTSSDQDFRETSFGGEDQGKFGSSLVTKPIEEMSSAKEGPELCKNHEENSSMACEEESQETVKLSEEMKDVPSSEVEIQNKSLESSLVKNVEDICFQKEDNLEISKEESETGMKDVHKEVQKEADNRNETLETTTTADISLSTTGGDYENLEGKADVSVMKPEESMTRESENVTPTKAEMASPSEYAETITNIKEESLVEIPEETLGVTREDETVIADDIDQEEITEAKNPSTVDSDEKTRSAEVFLEGGENENEVSMIESGDQVREASEVPKEDEKHASEAYEASESQSSNILEHTSTERAVNMEVTSTVSVVDIELDKGCEVNPEEQLKEPNSEENIKEVTEQKEKGSDSELQIPTKSDDSKNSTIEEDLPVKNNTPSCTGEEEHRPDQEDKIMSDSSKQTSPELDSGDQSCSTFNEIKNIDDQIINEETIQVYEDPKIADRVEDREEPMKNEEHTIADHSPEPTVEPTTKFPQENETETNMHKAKALETDHGGLDIAELIVKDSVINQSAESFEEKIVQESSQEDEAGNVHETASASTTTDERSITDIPSSSVGEEKVEEILEEDKGDEMRTEKEVQNSDLECIEQAFDATSSTEEREARAPKDEAEPNEGLNDQSTTVSSSQETTQKESNLDLLEHSSSVPEICEEEIKEEILEKEDSHATVAAEETSSTETKAEYIMRVDSSNLVSEEKCQVTTEMSETGANGIDIIAKAATTSILDENNAVEIPTTTKQGADEPAEKTEPEGNNETCDTLSKAEDHREIAAIETSSDDISEQMPQASSKLPPVVRETIGEAPENDENLYGKAETPLVAETTEEDTEKERANDDAWVEEQEFDTPLELNNEESVCEPDPELLKRVSSSEVADCRETRKMETVEELKSSEKDKSEYGTTINETAEGVEVGGGCIDIEKAILEGEDSVKNLEGSTKDSIEIEKAPVEFEAEGHTRGCEASEPQGISTLQDKNINAVDHDEELRFASEPMADNEGNGRFPETNLTNTEEESHDDENQNINSSEQISGQDIQEGERKRNEEMEPELETQKEMNETQDAILTEKASDELETARASTATEECSNRDLPYSSVGEQNVEEILKEDEGNEIRSEKEVRNSDVECFEQDIDATSSTEEREIIFKMAPLSPVSVIEPKALKDEAEPSEGLNAQSNTVSSSEETTRKESNLYLVDNSSSVPEIYEKENKEEILETEDSNLIEVAEEVSSTEAKAEYITQVDSSNLVSEEVCQVTTETSEAGSNGIDLIERPPETSILGENNAMEILTTTKQGADEQAEKTEPEGSNETCDTLPETEDQREIATGQTSSDDISEQLPQASFILPSGVGETTGEALENDKNLHGKVESPLVEETTEEDIREKEVESTKLDTVEELESSEKDKSEYGMAMSETAEGAEVSGGCRDTEKAILEEEDSAKNLEGCTKESFEIEKAPVEFEARGSEASDTESISTLKEKNIKIVEHDEKLGSASESMAEDTGNRRLAETNLPNTEEESHDDKNQNIDFTEQISGEDIKEGKGKMNEEMEPELETQKEINVTQDSVSTEKVSREIERASESEIIKQETKEEESSTKEVHMIPVAEETVSEVTDMDLTPTQSLEATTSNESPETMKSNVAEDLHKESEASPMTEEVEDEKPADVSSLISEGPKEKMKGENIEDAENCDDETNIASTVVTDITSLAEIQLTEEPTKALDASSDAEGLNTTKTADASQKDAEVDSVKLEETSNMVSQLPLHELEKADDKSATVEKSDACDVEVEETEIPGAVPESEDQKVKEVHESGTSLPVMETHTTEIEKQIREVPEALPEAINHGVEAVSEDEIIAPTVATEVTSSREVQLDEQVKALDTCSGAKNLETTEIADASQQVAEVDSMKLEQTFIMVSQLPIHELEKTDNEDIALQKSDANDAEIEENKILDTVPENDESFIMVSHLPMHENEKADTKKIAVEESDANEVGVEETGTLDTVLQSEDEAIKEIHETGTSLTVGEADTHEIEKQIRVAATADKIFPGQTLQAETIEEQLQVPTSSLLSKEQESETTDTIERWSTEEDGTEVDNLKLQENSGMVFQLPIAECDGETNAIAESSDVDEVKVKETKTLDAVSESKDQGFEEIHQISTSPAAENTEAHNLEEKGVTDPGYQGVDAADDDETLGHPLPVDKLEEQIQVPSSALFSNEPDCETRTTIGKIEDDSTKKDETEVDKSELEEAADTSKFPITEHEICNVRATIEKSGADEVQVEEANTSEAISESKGQGVEEIHETGSTQPVGKTHTDEVEEETQAIPETILEPTKQDAEAVTEGDISINQPLTTKNIEQLQEQSSALQNEQNHETATQVEMIKDESTEKDETHPNENVAGSVATSTTEKSCLPDEGQRELEVSNITELRDGEDHSQETTEEDGDLQKYTSQEKLEESEETFADKDSKESVTAEDRASEVPYQVSGGEGIANVTTPEEAKEGKSIEKASNISDLENQGDETHFGDTATETTTQIKEFKSSEVMLESHEETVISKDEQVQNTVLAVPPVKDAAPEEAPDEKVGETFDAFSEPPPKGPTHGIIETYEADKEIAAADTKNSESIMDNEMLEHTSLEPACEGSGVTENLAPKEQEVLTNKPSISSSIAASQETIADKESEKTADMKQNDFVPDKQTPEVVSVLEEGNSFQLEEHTKDKEPVDLSAMGYERKLDEAEIQRIITANEEETPEKTEKPSVLSHIKDFGTEASQEKSIMEISHVNEITQDPQGLEKTSLSVSHEQVAIKTDPSESIETTNSTACKDAPLMQDDTTAKTFQNVEVDDLKAGHASVSEPEAKGVECGEEKRMGEEESAKLSLSDLMQRSKKRNLQGVEHLAEERELPGNKVEQQTETADTVHVQQAIIHEKKDEEEEGDEHSGSDAPVMVEASRDMDVKVPHKKSHNILSGVGSKVKHSLAKVKKAITGKSSHPKPPLPE